MDKKPTIAEQIKAARKDRGIPSQNQLATISGLSQPQIHKIEAGGGCHVSSLQKIADATQTPITIHPTPPLITSGVTIMTRGE